ncbi:murein transglycosylase A [Terrihabitans sp. B22-R8]|uniref:murein transglycosylase A n=1 Tax=Terrihabitans sp. B22-R8 TaxID=3425128 RepID=UPI00403CA230
MISAIRMAAAALLAVIAGSIPAAAQQVVGADLTPTAFEALPDWAADDHPAAFEVFRKSCAKPVSPTPVMKGRSLRAPCQVAQALGRADKASARTFFEQHFQPFRVRPPSGAGFLTGYYEPEFSGSRRRNARHVAPLLAMPKALPKPAPDRGAIEAGALKNTAQPLVWLDPVDAFFVHIQGSARIRMEDGSVLRVAFAGRNGLPFTAIGKILVDRGELTREEVSMQTIRAWMLAHPAEAPALMRQNRSYIFFRIDSREGSQGPLGAQQVPLTAGRSLAVDRAAWQLGLPVWISGQLPVGNGEAQISRLMVAQDTGAAIKGPARGDIFVGSGDAAGHIAGLTKHPADFVVLLPRGSR